jgi:hypothetical protein
MICPVCGVNTKRLRFSMARRGYRHNPLVCQVCRRKEDGLPWRLWRVLQMLKLY